MRFCKRINIRIQKHFNPKNIGAHPFRKRLRRLQLEADDYDRDNHGIRNLLNQRYFLFYGDNDGEL